MTSQALAPEPDTVADHPDLARADNDRIVVLTDGGPLSWIMINAMVEWFGPVTILKEDKEPLSVTVRRCARLLGYGQAFGQVAFGVLLRLLHKLSRHRQQQIIDGAKLNPARPVRGAIVEVGSVNSKRCREELRRLNPDVVVVIGTRLIRKETLRAVDATFMSYHAGLNPTYRGMHGGYWALATGDAANFGVTMHLVDEGVDTGEIISYRTLSVTRRDNFTTYPLLQAAAARPLLINAVEDALEGSLPRVRVPFPSKQWFQPTIWSYASTGLLKGVW